MSPLTNLCLDTAKPEAIRAAVVFIAEHDNLQHGTCLTCIRKLASVDLMRVLFGITQEKLALLVACHRRNHFGLTKICTEETHEDLEGAIYDNPVPDRQPR